MENFQGRNLLNLITIVIRRHFPDFFTKLSLLEEHRKRPQYTVQEIYMACISMFLFKQKSRNDMNNCAKTGFFKRNYMVVFGMKLPHMDSVALFMEQAEPAQLEKLKREMLQYLISKKVFHKFLINGLYPVAIDGTGISSYDYEPWDGCPYKKYKAGKTVWQVPILEAKLVFMNGFSISFCTQWILNTADSDKQSCELKAFKEISEKIKKQFPRLPIVILADGLYPKDSVFTTCQNNSWKFIITLKDKSLKIFQETIGDLLFDKKYQSKDLIIKNKPEFKKKQTHRFINGLNYKTHQLSWFECVEEIKTVKNKIEKNSTKRFVYLTNIRINNENILNISKYARQRWRIENEGFDTQKHHGYELEHKFSRKSLVARQNYYQSMQIAHLINQLVERSQKYKAQSTDKESVYKNWERMLAYLWLYEIPENELKDILKTNCQIRY